MLILPRWHSSHILRCAVLCGISLSAETVKMNICQKLGNVRIVDKIIMSPILSFEVTPINNNNRLFYLLVVCDF